MNAFTICLFLRQIKSFDAFEESSLIDFNKIWGNRGAFMFGVDADRPLNKVVSKTYMSRAETCYLPNEDGVGTIKDNKVYVKHLKMFEDGNKYYVNCERKNEKGKMIKRDLNTDAIKERI